MSSLKGHLLVAVPKLCDPNFFRTVSLVVEHTENGALGLVLNRLSPVTIQEVWEQVRKSACSLDARVHLGGPCEGYLTALHTNATLADSEVLPGLHFSQTPRRLERLVSRQEQPIRFFLGFAGWSSGQLESELGEGSWLTAPAGPEDVFRDHADFWVETFRRLAGPGVARLLNLPHVPADPSAN